MQTTRTSLLLMLALGVLWMSQIHAQDDYKAGHIVTLEGDTIQGIINYRNWSNNPDHISFKASNSDEATTFWALDIHSFGVEDEYYVGAIVDIETSPKQTKDLNYDSELQLRKDTTFLQTIIQGDKSLYYHQIAASKKRNMYIKHNGIYELLVMKKYILRLQQKESQGPQKGVFENKRYQTQLLEYLQDCPYIKSKISNIQYHKNDLRKLFKSYYDCVQQEATYQKKPDRAKLEFGAIIGGNITSLNFTSPTSFPYLVSVDYPISIDPLAGGFFELILPRTQEKWSINTEVIFTNYSTQGSYEQYVNENNYQNHTTEWAYTYMRLNTMLRYTYPINQKSLKIYTNIGFSNNWALRETNYRLHEQKFFVTYRLLEEKGLEETKKYEQGYYLGLGAKWKRYSFEMRYERSGGMSPYFSLKSIVRRYFCFVGYRF